MADKKFSELGTASEIKNSDFMALSQDTGNGLVSLKATILAIATKILTAINFTSALDTTNKTVIGAINEVAQGGGGGGASTEIIADDFDATSTYAVGDYVVYDGKLYKCTTAVSTAGQWDANDWAETIVMDEVEQGGGGTGGHTIIDENGTSMTARAGLQFVGANVSDDATNNKTIVDISGGGGGFGLVQSGHTVYTLTGQNLEDRVSITFDTPFPEVPNVALSLSDPSRGQYYNPQTGLGVMNVTENGFEILIKSSSQAVAGDIVIYWIATTKFSGNGIFHPTIYSLEEREIGVWKDGKPLYVRTYNVTFSSNYTDITIDTTHEVKLLDGGVDSNANDNFIHLGYGTSQNDMCGAYEYEAGKIRFQNFYYSSRPNGWLNVYYTKSTDTAGSGSWTPQGVPTHHYSTDEQVIGTWIDGNTLYEKTILINNGGNLSTGDNLFAHNITNLAKVIDAKGNVIRNTGSSGERNMVIPYASGENNWDIGIYEFSDTNGYVKVGNSYAGDYILHDCYVTIQYTKTS